ncbi:Peroxiredoxin [Ignavibacterium album JCM 16511]|uniref:Peroxiredoxin n=1 Tax=Ignavibacterium album (strain DSM 19864 / JCM 16511 / NBRC 101810 / Mat9-16) TaxID=945713 RepID=I0AKY8_IGNAJ|nr:peroxiredoxin-like family protein [Ignavibacterium album]AFH49645.1 Peroxiredoxin [Ignavibacterium album JCM 16511]
MKLIPYLLLVLLTFSNIFGDSSLDNRKKVANSASEICPIKIGEKIPPISIRNLSEEEIDLNKFLSGKKTILIFYRGGWCPYCNMQLSELNSIEDELIKLGYQTVAISMDKPSKLKESISEHNLKYVLLSDSRAEASIAFGLAFKVADDYNKMLLGHNINLEEASGEKHHILPVPAVFIVSKDGTIKFEYVNPDYKVRLNSVILLKAAEQYSRSETN